MLPTPDVLSRFLVVREAVIGYRNKHFPFSLQPINCILVFDRTNLFRHRTLLGEAESEMLISQSGESPTFDLVLGVNFIEIEHGYREKPIS